jgi:hypothetical protein
VSLTPDSILIRTPIRYHMLPLRGNCCYPSRGQCGSTALVIHDLLGGELLIAEVLRSDGSRQGVHYWNLLPDGTELDLTREQFADDEVLQQPRILRRPAGLPNRCADQYLTMRCRVFDALGISKDDGTSRL